MGNNGQLWAIMGNYGQLWAIMGNYGQLWVASSAKQGNYGLLRQRSRAIMGKEQHQQELQTKHIIKFFLNKLYILSPNKLFPKNLLWQ